MLKWWYPMGLPAADLQQWWSHFFQPFPVPSYPIPMDSVGSSPEKCRDRHCACRLAETTQSAALCRGAKPWPLGPTLRDGAPWLKQTCCRTNSRPIHHGGDGFRICWGWFIRTTMDIPGWATLLRFANLPLAGQTGCPEGAWGEVGGATQQGRASSQTINNQKQRIANCDGQ